MSRWLRLLVWTVSIPGLSGCAQVTVGTEGGINSRTAAQLNDEVREALQADALQGSREAAWRVYLHYATVESSRARSERIYWAQIAAENGDSRGELAYAMMLLRGDRSGHDPRRERRGCFWLRRAAAS